MRLVLFLFLFLLSPAIWANNHFAEQPEVKKFIAYMVRKHHFTQNELTYVLNQIKIRPAVIRNITTPLEKKPWYMYQMLFVNEWRIREGVEFWNKYENILTKAEKKYGVPASIIVATIGIETKYGKNTGNYRVIDALANIAFSPSSRAKFFRHELEEFLLLAREQHLNPLTVMGSYAGAIGQPQFMPSSYRHYAINFSGDDKIDLSHNEADVIGSIANYYHKHGWQPNQPIVLRANLHAEKTIQKPVIELQNYFNREYWVSYPNFDVIKRYNPSNLYAMAVYQLSYYITELKERS